LANSPVSSPLMNGPSEVAVLPDGSRAYVVNAGATTGCSNEQDMGQVLAINANSVPASVGCITVGKTPNAIVAAGDGSRVYVTHQGDTLVAGGIAVSRGVTVVNPATNQVVTDLPAPFTNPTCTTANPVCIDARMYPVFVVSQ
jgi:DNA-binding beta-propeller fold protein YncE